MEVAGHLIVKEARGAVRPRAAADALGERERNELSGEEWQEAGGGRDHLARLLQSLEHCHRAQVPRLPRDRRLAARLQPLAQPHLAAEGCRLEGNRAATGNGVQTGAARAAGVFGPQAAVAALEARSGPEARGGPAVPNRAPGHQRRQPPAVMPGEGGGRGAHSQLVASRAGGVWSSASTSVSRSEVEGSKKRNKYAAPSRGPVIAVLRTVRGVV